MTIVHAHGYEVLAGSRVRRGKFEAGLSTLEDCSLLFSPAGRAHKVPAWIINELAQLARVGAAHVKA